MASRSARTARVALSHRSVGQQQRGDARCCAPGGSRHEGRQEAGMSRRCEAALGGARSHRSGASLCLSRTPDSVYEMEREMERRRREASQLLSPKRARRNRTGALSLPASSSSATPLSPSALYHPPFQSIDHGAWWNLLRSRPSDSVRPVSHLARQSPCAMAAGNPASLFDDIIQADRQKRKNEALANQILGKNRRASAPGSGFGSKKQTPTPGSLASRIGVVKRSASASFKPKQNNLASARPAAVNRRRPNDGRLAAALQPENGQATVRENDVGFVIKGAGAGPFVVLGSNFAPGTTAADIQSAFEPVGGEMVSCRITSQYPTVTAEMAFTEKWGAENVVANFNNRKADGRILSLRLKPTGAAALVPDASAVSPPTGPRALRNPQTSFDGLREQADRERRQNRRADPQVQDGSFGFGDAGNARHNARRGANGHYNGRGGHRAAGNARDEDKGLYSDAMMVDAPAPGLRNKGRGFR
ncbi:hypothetical protein VTN02DRAFT_6454 [Thermoascus thermophilus]